VSGTAGTGASWEIVFDGGSKGNPGRGYGSFRLRPTGGEWEPPVELNFEGRRTNNEAEYLSLTGALRALAERVADPSAVAVTVRGDSKLVLEQLAGNWKVRTASLRPYWAEAKAELERFGRVRMAWHGRKNSVDLLGH
jgi:ribonuclease HI